MLIYQWDHNIYTIFIIATQNEKRKTLYSELIQMLRGFISLNLHQTVYIDI